MLTLPIHFKIIIRLVLMDEIKAFDWFRMWFSHDTPWGYFGEIAFRTVIMFVFLLMVLKLLSKRGVKQLSVFELAILIALGSATGDPMFYYNIPLLQGMLVMVLVILIYRLVTHFTYKSAFMEALLEGKPVCLLKDGRIDYASYQKVKLPSDKFFAELRQKSVDHLGQVRRVYLETSGDISVYLQEDEDVRPGLPIYPELLTAPLEAIAESGVFACTQCGQTEKLLPSVHHVCSVCQHACWLPAWNNRRVS